MLHDETILRGKGKAAAVADLPAAELRRLLEDPEALLWENLDRPVKIDHANLMVQAVLPLRAGEVRAAYKRYRPRNWWKAFCSLFRRSRARRAWRLSSILISGRIATARPLAVCEPSRPRFRRTSYLATEWIEDAENLHLYGWRLAAMPIHRRLRYAARCARCLGRLIGQMHAAGIAHRDLKAANLLVVQPPEPGGERRTSVYLVDTDGMQPRRRLSDTRRAANLARLAAGLEAHPWVTPSICCRFLRAYAQQFPRGTIAWKPLWRSISVRAAQIGRRKRRRGERVL